MKLTADDEKLVLWAEAIGPNSQRLPGDAERVNALGALVRRLTAPVCQYGYSRGRGASVMGCVLPEGHEGKHEDKDGNWGRGS